jgi:hypothetical protein
MAKKLIKTSLPTENYFTMSPTVNSKKEEERERRWKAEDALRTAQQYEKNCRDKELMKDMKKIAQEQMKDLQKVIK